MRNTRIYFIVIALIFCASQQSWAQSFSGEFGKNRMQFSNFQWNYLSAENYEVYYYRNGKGLAMEALDILEKEYPRITNMIGYAPYIKTKIFIYNSLKDLQESNVGVDGKTFNENGQTDLIKLLVEVPYSGIKSEFEEAIVYNLSKTLLTDMMYGGSVVARFQSAYLLTLPAWYINGMARYLAYGWSVEMDDFIRDLLYHKNVKHLDQFEGQEAEILGQSVWNYISIRHGKTNISNILNLTRIVRDEEKSIANSISTPFKQFLFNWSEYYENASEKIEEAYDSPEKEEVLAVTGRTILYPTLALNPKRPLLAYAKIKDGRFQIIYKDLNSGKDKQIYSGGVRFHGRTIASEIPTMEWIDGSTLGVTFNQYGQLYLGIINIETGKKIKKALPRLNQIKSIDFNDNGKLAVVSAEVKGQNDLYLLSMYRNAIKRLTNDSFDDIEPHFVPGTNKIVFSSNRKPEDEIQSDFVKSEDVFNLYLYDLDNKKEKVKRLTKTISSDKKPQAVDENTIYFLSDSRGINNLYKMDLSSSLSKQVTAYNNSILAYSLSNDGFAFSMKNGRKEKIFLSKKLLNQNTFTPATLRTELNQALFVKEKLKLAREKEKQIEDSIRAATPPQTYLVDSLTQDLIDPADSLDDKFIDTDGFVFDTEEEEEPVYDVKTVKPTVKKPTSFLSNYTRTQKEADIAGPYQYTPRFSVDNIRTAVFVDPIIGFGFRFEARVNELLENHKFYGKLETKVGFKSGRYTLSYKYTKHLIDFQISHSRKAMDLQLNPLLSGQIVPLIDDFIRQKYVLNNLVPGLSLPLTSTLRIEANAGFVNSRFVNQNASSLSASQAAKDDFIQSDNFGLLNTKLVFDNTVVVDADHVEGSLAKISYSQFRSLQDGVNGFRKLKIDLRHYQKIYRNMTFVTRLQYGSHSGENSPEFILGGVDGTFFGGEKLFNFNPINTTVREEDPLFFKLDRRNQNILFHEFVTDLRGYVYNRMSGQDVLLANAEIRLPITKFLTNEYVKSNFFRNLKFVGFYDIGAAWTGVSPLKKENSINTKTFEQSNFILTLKNFRFPWLMSYGAGVRTTLLGYYVKFDVGIPLQEFDDSKRTFHLSLGYDF